MPFKQDKELPFLEHLVELRDRLLRAILAILVIFLLLFSFRNELYTLLADPLMRYLPGDTSMIIIDPAGAFFVPVKLSLVLSIFIAMPIILFQLWGFVAPGLYQHEKRMAMPLLLSTTVLFYLGMVFAYFVVFPLMFDFLTSVNPQNVEVRTDISLYLDFVLKMFFAFGLAFEVPIATIILVVTGISTPEKMVKKRPYIIVGAFVLGMLLTPPDIISQTLLAIPIWLLFEAGVFFSRFFLPTEDIHSDNSALAVADTSPASSHVPESDPEQHDIAKNVTTDDTEKHQALSDDEMEAELDRIEAQEEQEEQEKNKKSENSESEGKSV